MFIEFIELTSLLSLVTSSSRQVMMIIEKITVSIRCLLIAKKNLLSWAFVFIYDEMFGNEERALTESVFTDHQKKKTLRFFFYSNPAGSSELQR